METDKAGFLHQNSITNIRVRVPNMSSYSPLLDSSSLSSRTARDEGRGLEATQHPSPDVHCFFFLNTKVNKGSKTDVT